jgi:hypothetical protein
MQQLNSSSPARKGINQSYKKGIQDRLLRTHGKKDPIYGYPEMKLGIHTFLGIFVSNFRYSMFAVRFILGRCFFSVQCTLLHIHSYIPFPTSSDAPHSLSDDTHKLIKRGLSRKTNPRIVLYLPRGAGGSLWQQAW